MPKIHIDKFYFTLLRKISSINEEKLRDTLQNIILNEDRRLTKKIKQLCGTQQTHSINLAKTTGGYGKTYYTVTEAVNFSGLSRKKIIKLIKNGTLLAIKHKNKYLIANISVKELCPKGKNNS